MKTMKFLLLAGSIMLGVLLFSTNVLAVAGNQTVTVVSPAGSVTWTRGTYQTVDFTFSTDSTLIQTKDMQNWSLNVYLDKADGSCVSGLPCPILLGNGTGASSPYRWLVGTDSNGRTIPDGQYRIRVYFPGNTAQYPPAQGTSGIVTIFTPTPTPTPAKTPTPTPRTTTLTGGTKTTTTTSAVCTDDATITSSDLPATVSLAPGATQVFHANVTNNGNTNWYDGTYYQLNNNVSQNLLSPPNGHLPNVVTVNGTVAWSFAITAPQTPGSYPINLQMVHISGGQYIKSTGTRCAAPANNTPFGQVLSSTVQVTAPSPTPSPSTTPIPTVGSSNWFKGNMIAIVSGLVLLLALIGGGVWLMKRRSGSIPTPEMTPPVPSAPTMPPPPAPTPVPPPGASS